MAAKLTEPFQLGAWYVDPALDTISRNGETVKLEPRTMRLLVCLAESPGAVISQERLLAEVWPGVVVSPASLYQAVSQLRRLLGDLNSEPSYIATVPRKGYRLVASTRMMGPPAVPSRPPPEPPTASSAGIPPAIVPIIPPTVEAIPPDATPAARSRRGWLWIAAACIAVIGVLVWITTRSNHATATATVRTMDSIVVLPFTEEGDDKQDQPFCDGLTQELSNWLAQIPDLRVVAQTSAFAFRDVHEDVRSIGRALGVTHVLEGSMRRSGGHVRIGVELVDARSGYHIWSSEYDRPLEDAIRIQEDVARSVAESLELRLTDQTAQQFAARRSSSPEGYRLYLLAQRSRLSRAPADNARAIELYRRSLSLDPHFAPSYVGLAYATLNEIVLNDRPVAQVQAAVEPLLLKASQIDPDLSELYAVRAGLNADLGRTKESLDDLHRALSLNPSDSWAYSELGRLHLEQGEPHQALHYLQQAMAVDPLDYMLFAKQCVALQDLARFAEATAACDRARSLHGDDNWAAVATQWLARAQGDLVQSLIWSEHILKADPDNIVAYERLTEVLLNLGQTAEARKIYEQARLVTHDEERVQLGLAQVAYFEQGTEGLRRALAGSPLDRSEHSRTLIDTAYLRLLLGDAKGAMALMNRARTAADFDAQRFNSPWFARWGESDMLILATAELLSGDGTNARAHLQQITELVQRMSDSGEQCGGLYALKAQVLALQGRAAQAMKALTLAVDLGWRSSWLAEHEPYLAALRDRVDFRALMAQVDQYIQEARSELRDKR